MSTKTNKELIRRYLDAIRQDKSPQTLDTFIAEEELKNHIATTEMSFPGYWIEIQDMMAEEDKVFVRGIGHGVQKGAMMNIPPSNKEINASLFIVYRIANHKIVEHWMLMDNLTLLQQIGALPHLETA